MISISVSQLFLAVLATAILSAATTGAALRIRYREQGVGRVVPLLTILVLLLNVTLLVWRAVHVADARHVLANRFDITLLFATLIGAVGCHSQWRAAIRGLDTFMLPVALFVQIFAFLGLEAAQLPGNLKSWAVVHQLSFVLGATLLVCGGVAGAAYLLLSRVLRSKQPSSMLWRLAPLEAWESSGRWSVLFGFLCLTFGALTGICQASRSPGTRPHDWLTDLFVISFVTLWVLYAVAIVATWAVPRFRGRRAAQLAVVSGVLLFVVFLVVEKLSGVHQ
jgi:hypothetical protein